jgi:hypothetical protein
MCLSALLPPVVSANAPLPDIGSLSAAAMPPAACYTAGSSEVFWEGATQDDFAQGNTGWGGLLGQVGAGLIPYYGQASDARDTVAGVNNVWQNPGSGIAWAGLGGAVLGWVPFAGDALKGAIRGGTQAAKEIES